MLGLMINDIEQKELEYLVKRELDELLLDMDDHRIDQMVKRAMKDRYKTLFQLLKRVSNEHECLKYIPKRKTNQ
ncbi:hypothetical protein [Ornithinibacillus halophilus]|uniref:Uncharacterized protein n=1 Tax=Ornithinibacillus halophilus TaxID=930117 RepID=A0A1M5H4W6_9BACI|nr:hypothetical protein [Ornithinibacillus halophilus]SHG11030.1 hypothetical protein SAMN05216225_10161 [Ornithinibacillus halophilus]